MRSQRNFQYNDILLVLVGGGLKGVGGRGPRRTRSREHEHGRTTSQSRGCNVEPLRTAMHGQVNTDAEVERLGAQIMLGRLERLIEGGVR